jgi:alkylation response protein AidB-like acyl-CoA dehydrogenase
MCVGSMKLMVEQATRYANQRQQFGRSISSFGAIRAKLAEMAIRTWVGESMVYRALGMIDAGIVGHRFAGSNRWLRAVEEYAVECSIIKVALSEYCNYVADEMVQIHGGYGYVADYPAERAYRDSRINRIFEGTNEINRLLVSSRLMNCAASKPWLSTPPEFIDKPGFAEDEDLFTEERKLVDKAKRVVLASLQAAAQSNKLPLSEQQVIMLGIADVIIDTFAMESAILRAKTTSSYQVDITQVFCSDAMQRIEATVRSTLSAMPGGVEISDLLTADPLFTPRTTVAARQRIAKPLIEAERWIS